jgi:hypothetical protein
MTMTYSNAAMTMVHQHYDYLQDDHADDIELSNMLDDIFPEMSQLQHQQESMINAQEQQNHFVPVSPSTSYLASSKVSLEDLSALQEANYKQPQFAARVSPVLSDSVESSEVVSKIPSSPTCASTCSRKRRISSVSETSGEPDKRQTVQRR